MTQPAARGPFPQPADAPRDPAEPGPQDPAEADPAGLLTPGLLTPGLLTPGLLTPGPLTPGPGPQRARWWWGAVIAAAGIPVGLLWWVLAPSGLNLVSGDPSLAAGTNIAAWLPRDLTLAGLFLLAGCITGVLVSGSKADEPTSRTVVLAVAAAAAGAIIAWGAGVLAAQWWGAPQDTSANAGIAFSLRSYPVLAVWPAAVALAAFLSIVFRKPAPPPSPRPEA